LDRIDIHLEVPPVKIAKLTEKSDCESSATVQKRVERAREKQQQHLKDINCLSNSELTIEHIRKKIKLESKADTLLKLASENLNLSARGYFRVMRVAKTIADLDESEIVEEKHVAEALQYRQKRVF